MIKALDDIKVLELEPGIGGSYCGKLLADLGAEVIKVEKPETGDRVRGIGPFAGHEPGVESSLLFQFLNTNKKSITLDIEREEGKHIFRHLARDVDLVIEGFQPDYLVRSGLGYSALSAINPRLVFGSITYFGQTGPYRLYKGSSIVASAMGGLMYITGAPDREPLKIAGWQAEYLAGAHASVGVMAAISAQRMSGRGQHLDVCIMESVASILEHADVYYSYTGRIKTRSGNRHGLIHPMTILPCKDGYAAVIAGGDWENFVRFSGIEALRDERFNTGEERLEHADEIDELLRPWLREKTRNELFHSAQEWRIPFAMVMGIDELFDDPQLQAREFFNWLKHPVIGDICLPGAPFRMDKTPWQSGRAPMLGEHNFDVYDELFATDALLEDYFPADDYGLVTGDNAEVYGRLVGPGRNEIEKLKQQGVI